MNRWTCRFNRWLDSLKLDQPADQFVFLELRHHIRENTGRFSRLEAYIKECVEASPWRPAIKALQCLRGFKLVSAATVVAELGDIARFSHPRRLMSYAGLAPGESSSGNRVRRLFITKAGNTHLRRILAQAAWHSGGLSVCISSDRMSVFAWPVARKASLGKSSPSVGVPKPG